MLYTALFNSNDFAGLWLQFGKGLTIDQQLGVGGSMRCVEYQPS